MELDEPTTKRSKILLGPDIENPSPEKDRPETNAGHTRGLPTTHSPLQLAVCHNIPDNIREFISSGADVHIQDDQGRTPLHDAIRFGHCEAVRILLDNLASSEIEDNCGLYPVSYVYGRHKDKDASSCNEIIKCLTELGVNLHKTDNKGKSLLHGAVRWGDRESVELLVEHGLDVNHRDTRGNTVLHDACRWSDLETVKYICEKGASVNVMNDNRESGIHIALRDRPNPIPMISYLLENMKCAIDIDHKDRGGNAVLHVAAGRADIDTVKYLHCMGASINIKNSEGKTVLHCVFENDNPEALLGYFLDNVQNDLDVDHKDDHGETVLHDAVRRSNIDLVRYLCDKGASVNIVNNDGDSVLHLALLHHKNPNSLLRLFLDDVKMDLDINHKGSRDDSALHVACRCSTPDTVEYLCDKGASVNVVNDDGESVLHLALQNVENSKNLLCCFLEDLGGDVDVNHIDNNGETVLHASVKCSNLDLVRYLCGKDASVNIVNNDGESVLHIALRYCDDPKPLLNFFLDDVKTDLDINHRNNQSETPLHVSSRCSNLECAQYLCEKGASVNAVNNDDATVVHIALYSSRNPNPLVRYFLDHVKMNLDINHRDKHGNTVLHAAVSNTDVDTVNILCGKGASVNIVNNTGKTVLHCALYNENHKPIINYLLDRFDGDIDLDRKDSDGDTVLHMATQFSDVPTVECLCGKGASVHAVNKHGRNVLHLALSNGLHSKSLLTLFLVEMKMTPGLNQGDKDGNTVLHLATAEHEFDLVKYLCEAGASVNDVNKNGKTLLHIAVMTSVDTVKKLSYLLDNMKIDLSVKDADGLIAVEFARTQSAREDFVLSEVVQLFREHGCDVSS